MLKKFLYYNVYLLALIALLFFVLSFQLSSDVRSSLGNLQGYFKTKNVDILDATFEEVNITSIWSFEIKNLRVGFDFLSNNLNLKPFLKIENISVDSVDFLAKKLSIKMRGVHLNYANSDRLSNSNWSPWNYPFVGIEGNSFAVVFANDQQSIRKTLETNLKEFLNVLESGSTSIKFDFAGKLKFNSNSAQEEISLEVVEKDGKYLLKSDLSNFILNIKYLIADDLNINLLTNYFYAVTLLDLEFYISKETGNISKEKVDYSVDAYPQVLSGYLLKTYFKEGFVNKFLELKLKAKEYTEPSIREMYLGNFKLGMSYADSAVKEEDLKKIIYKDPKVRLRPSNSSIKIK